MRIQAVLSLQGFTSENFKEIPAIIEIDDAIALELGFNDGKVELVLDLVSSKAIALRSENQQAEPIQQPNPPQVDYGSLVETTYQSQEFYEGSPNDTLDWFINHGLEEKNAKTLLRNGIGPRELFNLLDDNLAQIKGFRIRGINFHRVTEFRDHMRREGPDMKPIES